MFVLALDTTTRSGSIAIVTGDRVVAECVGDAARPQGERLPLDLMRTLAAASVSIAAIDLLAVAAGPGSFTGLRVGIATMQGLAMATGRRIVPISALDAVAATGGGDRPVAAWIDAQRGEVFAALYDATGTRALIDPTALAPGRTLDMWASMASASLRFIGDGAVRYAEMIRDRLGRETEIRPAPPLAGMIGRMAARVPERAVLPHAIVPIYIRRPDAELARAKQAADRSSRMDAVVIERLHDGDDLDAVAALEAASFTNPWTREMLDRELRQSDVARVYVLRRPGQRVAAFCACWVVLDELHINTIAVDRDRRREGLATALMRYVLVEAARDGARRATLEVRRSNEPAQRLYASLGFVVAGVRRGYYTQPEEDALILWLGTLPGESDEADATAGIERNS